MSGPGGRGAAGVGPGGLAALIDAAIAAYQRLTAGWLAPRCRFHPSCSAYARQLLREHPLVAAACLAAGRLARCHPFARGGHDPVPPAGGAR